MSIKEIEIRSHERTSLIDVTGEIENAVRESGIKNGICHLFVPHTTAGITINENADPSVKSDILKELNKVIPFEDRYSHIEGNAAAHIKSTIVGTSQSIFIKDGKLLLGTWQGIYFCEFDGPRRRKLLVKIVE